MQQPYLSSPPESGGVPQRPAQVPSQHADAHIPWRSSSAPSTPNTSSMVVEATVASAAPIAPVSGPERTFRVPHPVLSLLSWLIAVASVAWLAVLGVNLTHLVLSGLEHDSDFLVLTYGVYMACAFGFLCFGAFFGLHFGLGSSAHWRSSIRHPNRPY